MPWPLKGMRTGGWQLRRVAGVAPVIGAVVCAPPYVLGRIGLLMLGSRALFIPGLVIFLTGLTLQAGTTSAVKAIKMGARLTSGYRPPGQ